jgi:hypothetical protein
MSFYKISAIWDAKETVFSYLDEITNMLIDKGRASDDLVNDYPDGEIFHNEYHVDRSWSLSEANRILEQLNNDFLQELTEDKDIIKQACSTYKNTVLHYWKELIFKINQNEDIKIAANNSMSKEVNRKIMEIIDCFLE